MRALLIRLQWLLPKCKWVLLHGKTEQKDMRFNQLIHLCDEILEELRRVKSG